MLAKFDGLDYHIFLNRADVPKLLESPLETSLINFQENEDLKRRVTLRIGQNKNPDGAELKLDGSDNVIVTINHLAYTTLEDTQKLFTTYLKTDNKLRIQIQPF